MVNQNPFKKMFFMVLPMVIMVFFQNCGTRFESQLKPVVGSSNLPSTEAVVFVSQVTTTSAVADGSDFSVVKIFIVNDVNEPVVGVKPKVTINGEFAEKLGCTLSDNNGVSECQYTSTKAASLELTVTSPSLFKSNITFNPGPAWQIKVLAGQGQTATVGKSVLVEPKFQILDQYNNAVPNTMASFEVLDSGSISYKNAISNANGEVSPGTWTLGAQGTNRLSVSVGSVSQSITATAMTAVENPVKLVYLPVGSCSTGKIEVYVNNSPHPKHQFVNTGECIEMDKQVAASSLKVRCIDPTNNMLPSDFVGPAVLNASRNPATSCSAVHKI